jgi:hypothetical protein
LNFAYLHVECCLDLYYTIVTDISVSRWVIVLFLFFFTYSTFSCCSLATAVRCGPWLPTHSSSIPSGLLPLYSGVPPPHPHRRALTTVQWRIPPPHRHSEVLTNLSRIPSSVENTSVTT